VKTVLDYAKTLPLRVEEIIIFGSTARGERLWDSDIDLIVISEDFAEMNLHERRVFLLRFWKHKRIVLEGFGLTREEYNDRVKKSLWFKEIDKYGVKLKVDKS
jgi:predicted nucleotidyltransferase